jgi:hypothetical protein
VGKLFRKCITPTGPERYPVGALTDEAAIAVQLNFIKPLFDVGGQLGHRSGKHWFHKAYADQTSVGNVLIKM